MSITATKDFYDIEKAEKVKKGAKIKRSAEREKHLVEVAKVASKE